MKRKLRASLCFCFIITERRKEEDYDEEVEEDLQDEVQLNAQFDCFVSNFTSSRQNMHLGKSIFNLCIYISL